MDTIAQRIAGITQRPAMRARPSVDPEVFAAVLQQQLDGNGGAAGGDAATFAQHGAALLPTTAVTYGRSPVAAVAPPATATALAYPPSLPPGVRLSGQPSLITPAFPAAAAVAPAAAHGHAHGVGHVHEPPPLDRVGPPAELQAYGNGRIPPEALAPLGVDTHMLWAPAAHAAQDMIAAAAADGVSIGVTSSYRSYEKQVELADRLGLYSQGGLAATPGTSNHGWGLSLDLDLDDSAQAWMREHGRDYGFVEDVPREPWHWTFKASRY